MADMNQPTAVLTGARQTMMTWAKVARSLDEVPDAFREACGALVGSRPVFPYVVFAPSMGGTRHRNADRLLCDVDDTLYIFERVGQRLITTGYPWPATRDIEYGNSLLYSWITLSGRTTQGVDETSTVTFNLATARYFRPFIDKVRPTPAPADAAKLRASGQQAKFDSLAKASFKFASFARESLAPGAPSGPPSPQWGDRAASPWDGQGQTVRLTVADNGAGFDPNTVTADHLGLKIMHERAEAIGARLSVYSEPGEGTQISVTWTQ